MPRVSYETARTLSSISNTDRYKLAKDLGYQTVDQLLEDALHVLSYQQDKTRSVCVEVSDPIVVNLIPAGKEHHFTIRVVVKEK